MEMNRARSNNLYFAKDITDSNAWLTNPHMEKERSSPRDTIARSLVVVIFADFV